jgi:hypothetical protein
MQILLEWQSCIATAIATIILQLQSKLRICRQSTPISIHNEAEYGMLKQVAVTGAGGFIASWIVKLLLQEGYHVQAAVRNLGDDPNSHIAGSLMGWGASKPNCTC